MISSALREQRRPIALSTLFIALCQAGEVAVPFLIGVIIDRALHRPGVGRRPGRPAGPDRRPVLGRARCTLDGVPLTSLAPGPLRGAIPAVDHHTDLDRLVGVAGLRPVPERATDCGVAPLPKQASDPTAAAAQTTGAVVLRGLHAELTAREGPYATLRQAWSAQRAPTRPHAP